jgi:hypothetical protein
LLLYSSYLPLGVPNWTVLYIINTVPHHTLQDLCGAQLGNCSDAHGTPLASPTSIGVYIAVRANLDEYSRSVFAALCWTLLNVRNKFSIEGTFPNQPADILYKMLTYLQVWKPVARRKDRDVVERSIGRNSCTPQLHPRPSGVGLNLLPLS